MLGPPRTCARSRRATAPPGRALALVLGIAVGLPRAASAQEVEPAPDSEPAPDPDPDADPPGRPGIVTPLAPPDSPAAPHPSGPDEPGIVQDEAAPGKAKRKGRPDRLGFGGRVYVRDTLTGIDLAGTTRWQDERTIDDARVFLKFRPNKRTRMDIEVDFAGDKAKLKDTFIRYAPLPYLELTVGRFKRPVSFIGLESTWSLPRIERGLLSELRLETGRLLFAGGRGDGVAVALELPGPGRPELTVVVHASELANDLGLQVSDVDQDAFARFDLEIVPGLHLAAAGGAVGSLARRSTPESYRHRPFGTLEAFVETRPLRLWVEGMAGLNASTYVDGAQVGRFLAAQALLAPRLHNVGGLRSIEPYAAFGWFDPSTRQAGDRLTELTGGVALRISGKLRLQLEGGRRIPESTFAASAAATIIRVQLGAAFKSETELR
jgi:hypothetical protein